jgi:predicted metal-dependent hydrolase
MIEVRGSFDIDPEDVITDLRDENALLRKERTELQNTVLELYSEQTKMTRAYDDLSYQYTIDIAHKEEIVKLAHSNMKYLQDAYTVEVEALRDRIKELIKKEHDLVIDANKKKYTYKMHVMELKCAMSELQDEASVVSAATTEGSVSVCTNTGIFMTS